MYIFTCACINSISNKHSIIIIQANVTVFKLALYADFAKKVINIIIAVWLWINFAVFIPLTHSSVNDFYRGGGGGGVRPPPPHPKKKRV